MSFIYNIFVEISTDPTIEEIAYYFQKIFKICGDSEINLIKEEITDGILLDNSHELK